MSITPLDNETLASYGMFPIPEDRSKQTYHKIAATEVHYDQMLRLVQKELSVISDDTRRVRRQMGKYFAMRATGHFVHPIKTRFLHRSSAQDARGDLIQLLHRLADRLELSGEDRNHAISWAIQAIGRFMREVRSLQGGGWESVVLKAIRTQFGAICYFATGCKASHVRDNFLKYFRLSFYFGLSYAIDDLIDAPGISTRCRETLSEVLHETIARRRSPEIKASDFNEKEYRALCLASNYLTTFSEEISGLKTEQKLRSIILAFHNAQLIDLERKLGSNDSPEEVYTDVIRKAFYSNYILGFLFEHEPSKSALHAYYDHALLFQYYDDWRDYEQDLTDRQFTPLTGRVGQPVEMFFKSFQHMINSFSSKAEKQRVALRFIQVVRQADLAPILRDYEGEITPEMQCVIDAIKEYEPPSDESMRVLEQDRFVVQRLKSGIVKAATAFDAHRVSMNRHLQMKYEGSDRMNEAIAYALDGGKCGRSFLCRLLAEHYGKPLEAILPLMESVELAQTASLVFDDLPAQDDAEMRRGKETLHRKEEEYVAQLAGIAMIMESFLAMANSQADPEAVLRLIQHGAEAMGSTGMARGQLIDLEESAESFEDFIELYRLKTSLGFQVPLVGTAILCGRDEDCQKLKRFSDCLGIAYQIRDDLLEEMADDKEAGRVAKRIIDCDEERARTVFYAYRKEAIDIAIALMPSHQLVPFMGIIHKLLALPGESDLYLCAS